MKISLNLDKTFIDDSVLDERRGFARQIVEDLYSCTETYNGWVKWPSEGAWHNIPSIEAEAERIRDLCDVLVVVGIGGSYLGTAAILEALGGNRPGCPDVIFAGTNLSGAYHSRLLKSIADRDVCMCVVSKSGTTMESRLAFTIMKRFLDEKYGAEAYKRIVAITDPVKGLLREETEEKGYASFEIPANIGGRYSAFTPAILFPLAVAGIDIRRFVQGAKDMEESSYIRNEALDYALTRLALMESGKDVEIFEYYDPCYGKIGEWAKQLFAESEGKEGKGLLPVSLTFSTDLHSIGQFLQEGRQMFFETLLNVRNWGDDVEIPFCAGNAFDGRMLNEINALSLQGVVAAHSKAGIPIVQIDIEENDEYCLGQLMYFMMITTAVTGKMMGVDPFTQDGVEKYKAEIRALLD